MTLGAKIMELAAPMKECQMDDLAELHRKQ